MNYLLQLLTNFNGAKNRMNFQAIQKQLKCGDPIKIRGQSTTATKLGTGNVEMAFQPCFEIEKIAKITYPVKEEICACLKSYDSSFSFQEYPSHYPVQMLEGLGKVPKNIFLASPKSPYHQGQLEFEFIDAWANIANQAVFPGIEIVDRPSI